MDFAQARLKLRVAVCPFVAPSGPDFHHRVVGVKRDSAVLTDSLPILRQFLLLLPLDCTFADLTGRALSQYEKLYQNQPAYVKLKQILLFRDSNQCDLDGDFLVSDICASNDLIYAMVEIDESTKKPKTSGNINSNNQNQNNNQNNQNANKNQKMQNEKKVPEFKPTPIKSPNTANVVTKPAVVDTPKPVEAVNAVEVPAVPAVKAPFTEPVKAKKEAPVKKEPQIKKDTKPVINETPKHVVEAVKPVVTETVVPAVTESVKTSSAETADIAKPVVDSHVVFEPVITAAETVPSVVAQAPVKPTPVKKPTKKVQAVPAEVVSVASTAPTVPVIEEVKPAVLSYSDAVTSSTLNSSMITPGPTPTPSRSATSTPIFHPRKTQTSSESEDEDEVDSILNSFDASNLFGSQVIASEPRRSDAFVLFAAGSDTESESESEVDAVARNASPPLKSSSIVSLQAGPSSEIDPPTSEDDEDESETESTQPLPHSITLKRLNSCSPIPDSSEIPSLDELKESLNRAPTPIQIINNQQQQQQQQKQKNNQQQVKGGRPAKKQSSGRPAVKKQQHQQPKQQQSPVKIVTTTPSTSETTPNHVNAA